MKEDKMENIHLIFKFLWYSVLFCIWEYLVQVPELIKDPNGYLYAVL